MKARPPRWLLLWLGAAACNRPPGPAAPGRDEAAPPPAAPGGARATRGRGHDSARLPTGRPAPERPAQTVCSQAELSVIARLRALSAAQAMLQHSRRLDTDGDGIGEFGLLTDLLGCGPTATRDGTLTEPLRALVARELGPIAPDGAISDGYRLQLWLPAADRTARREPGNGDPCGRHHDRAETAWCAYAWPAANGGPRLTFHIDASGEVFSTDAGDRYVGIDGPAVAAALPRSSAPFAARPQHGEVASDGLVWLREP